MELICLRLEHAKHFPAFFAFLAFLSFSVISGIVAYLFGCHTLGDTYLVARARGNFFGCQGLGETSLAAQG